MTPQERDLLQRFLGDLQQSQGAVKDGEADGMIADALRRNPDAGYVLVQHALMADQALQAAQQRIAALEQSGAGGQASGYPSGGYPGGGYPAAGAQPAQDGAWNEPQPEPKSPLSQNGGLGGFLRTAGTMAAGVAGGEFLAEGLSNLFAPRDW